MQLNSIKKKLYQQKPKALIKGMINGKIWYRCKIDKGFGEKNVEFLIPKDECDSFGDSEDAQLLIRWMVDTFSE